ncbi:MAG: protein kinase domain-containing protein [Planctomycetota bacterium]|jgi:serine/threonine-protein kinase
MSISKVPFGELALKRGLVTTDQVEECVEIQRKLKDMGINKTLGAVMHDKKYLSMVEIKEILREATGSKDWNAIEGYQIKSKLGKGGMGSVYKALHVKLQKFVALKVLPPDLANDQEYLDRFNREATAAAKLNHPNIVQALDVGKSLGYHYFVMEYVDGETVKDAIEKTKAIDEPTALHITAQTAQALIHAWRYDLIHRDIKPSNLILSKQGICKLCDLGLAKNVQEDVAITQTGVIMGTPFYLSPEQARNENLDIRSDIYSLGVTLFHMVTGQVPFTGNTAATILYKHIFMEPPRASTINPEVSEATSDLIAFMLMKSKDERPEDPEALYKAVSEVMEEVCPDLLGANGQLVPMAPMVDLDDDEEEEAAEDDSEVDADFPTLDSSEDVAGKRDTLTLPEKGHPKDTGTLDLPESYDESTGHRVGTLTGELTSGMEGVEGPKKRSVPVRPILIAASVLGLIALSVVVVTEVSALATRPVEAQAKPGGVFERGTSAAVKTAIQASRALAKKRQFGAAAAALEAVWDGEEQLSASDEIAIRKDIQAIATRARDTHRQAVAAFRKAQEANDPEAAHDALEQIERLDMKRVAKTLERDARRTEALATE